MCLFNKKHLCGIKNMVGAVLELRNIMRAPQMDKFNLILAAKDVFWDILIPQLTCDDFDSVGPYPFSYHDFFFLLN